MKGIEEDEQSQLGQMQAQLMQYEQQLTQSTELLAKQKEIVDKVVSVIQENNKLKSMLASLYTEAKTKIEQSNAQVRMGNAKIAEVERDATDFAIELDKRMRTDNSTQ